MKKTIKAFTLVELIIVIAVIGVLAAILIPVFANVIEKSNNKSALSDAKNALEIYIAEATDSTGSLFIGEGSVFKIRKANNDWYYTYYEQALHEGTGAVNSNPLNPIPVPANSVKVMSHNSYYIAEQDAETEFYDNLPDTVIIYNTGEGATYTPPAEEDEYDGEFVLIYKPEQLTTEFFSSHGMGGKYKLKNNITLTGDFTPIGGEFTGEFNGNGKTISGLNINEPTVVKVGMFTQLNGAKLYSFTLGVNTITGKGSVGTVASVAYNTEFTDVHVNITGYVANIALGADETFAGSINIGGFCSFASTVTLSKCSVKGEVRSMNNLSQAGGFFSHLNGTMSECFFSGTLSGNMSGGLVNCLSNATIRDCYAKVRFHNAVQPGGIANIGVNGTSNRIQNCISVCAGIEEAANSGGLRSAAFVINYHHATEVINCYTLSDDPLTQHPYYFGSQNESLNGTLVDSFSNENCPALNALGTLWSFAGGNPTLVNNPE